MKQTLIHISLDVDDTQFHSSASDKHSGVAINYTGRPTLKGLLSQFEKLSKYFPKRTLTV